MENGSKRERGWRLTGTAKAQTRREELDRKAQDLPFLILQTKELKKRQNLSIQR